MSASKNLGTRKFQSGARKPRKPRKQSRNAFLGFLGSGGSRESRGESGESRRRGESRRVGESRGESGGGGGREVIRKEASRGESGRVGESRGESGAEAGRGSRGSGNLAGDCGLVWRDFGRENKILLDFFRKYKSADAKAFSRHHVRPLRVTQKNLPAAPSLCDWQG